MAKRKKEGNAEEKILAAAKKVFVHKGMYGARMQDIADEAGINKALLHYYFKNKEKLFEVIFREAAQQLFPKINMIFESDLPLFEKLEKFTDEYITIILENPYLPSFVLNEINSDPQRFFKKIWSEKNRPKPLKFLEQIENEVRKGSIQPVSPVQLLMNLLSLCIFPFVARPMFQANLGIDDIQFRAIMEQRKKTIPQFLIDSIRK